MSTPPVIFHLSWTEHFRSDCHQERRYRNPVRAARQVLAILSAPDDVVSIRELAVTDGWEHDALSWRTLEPREFVATHLVDDMAADGLGTEISVMEKYERIAAAWEAAQERVVAGGPDAPVLPSHGDVLGVAVSDPSVTSPARPRVA